VKHKLFAYGTLQLPEVTHRVLGRSLYGAPAVLNGYYCGMIQRANFPGITPSSEHCVAGLVLPGLTPSELYCLDQYEGELYQRIQVSVQADSRAVSCWAYVIASWAQSRISDTPWSIEWYRRTGAKGRLTYHN
jgi:gamma-glutamylcyclotransferase (GGCT)/AIG2-like uncharacterized protein YtfP